LTSKGARDSDEAAGTSGARLLAVRGAIGGTLMGLANLVPGISGGTMLLASGVYTGFIDAIAELTTLRFRMRSLLLLAAIVGSAALAILMLAGSIRDLVVHFRWLMYSLFIGLTLGGVPVLWQMARPATNAFWSGMVAGLLLMVALAWLQFEGASSGANREGVVMMLAAGVAGASAMILPGVSGGYLLLVLGVYVPVLSAIDALKEAVKSGALATASEPIMAVVLPVGVGVAIGILLISNLIKIVLERHEQPTLGVLMGLLVGAVFGLWPFQDGVAPKVGDMFKGQVLTSERLAELTPDKFPTEFYTPTFNEVMMALGLLGVGYMVTTLVARVGGTKPARSRA